ncbi:MAG: DPP IV N-terminal domain-containing protein [Planctomycetota bacterium]|nr:DPP IV N-terminal domain-containing protein [Planctomycetota bacterium]
MSEMHGKIIRWVLAGGAFVAVLVTAGCASTKQSPSALNIAAPTESSMGDDVKAPAEIQPVSTANTGNKPQIINIFGEFDGLQRNPGRPAGDGGFQQHTFVDEGFDSDVNLDPTGKWMVFTSTRHSEHPNVYLQRVDGTSVIQLTNDEADYAYPTISPDGKQIAFCSTRGGNWDIYIMDMEGKNVVQVTTGPMQHIHPSFSPDGNRLVYSSLGGKSDQWELWTVDLATNEKRMIGFGLFPTWSPSKDVDRIAFQRARQRGSRWFSVWTLELVGGEARRITEVSVSSNAAIVSPTWSPDGKRLAFATIAEPSDATAVKPVGQQDIWMVEGDGSNRRRLTDGVGTNLSPCWAADNRIFFVSDRTGTECIWSVAIDSEAKPSKVAVGSASE